MGPPSQNVIWRQEWHTLRLQNRIDGELEQGKSGHT
jgi:hypothetical protein